MANEYSNTTIEVSNWPEALNRNIFDSWSQIGAAGWNRGLSSVTRWEIVSEKDEAAFSVKVDLKFKAS